MFPVKDLEGHLGDYATVARQSFFSPPFVLFMYRIWFCCTVSIINGACLTGCWFVIYAFYFWAYLTELRSSACVVPPDILRERKANVVFCRLPKKYLEGCQELSAANAQNGSAVNGNSGDESAGKSPLLIFINAGSGGRVGEELSKYFQQAVGSHQVDDFPDSSFTCCYWIC